LLPLPDELFVQLSQLTYLELANVGLSGYETSGDALIPDGLSALTGLADLYLAPQNSYRYALVWS
jgi:hypothetical protein